MPEIVSNTTPLQYLHQIGLLGILPGLYGRILVPAAVADEITAGTDAGVELPDLSSLGWVEVRRVAPLTWPVPRDIHRGEAEVIALAGTLGDPLLVIDDLAARRHAGLLNLKCTGTLGVLLKAKQAGLIDSVSPHVVRLEERGFRLSPATRQDFISLAGE